MHAIFSAAVSAFVQLIGWVSNLSSAMAFVADRAPAAGDFAMAAMVASSVIMAIACCAWAIVERLSRIASDHAMNLNLSRAQAEIRFREAMISACPEAIAVLGVDLTAPLSYRGGGALLQACLAGPDSAALAVRLDALMAHGTAFTLTVRTPSHPAIAVRGCAVGSRATVFLRTEDVADSQADYRAILNALPMSVWLRNRNLALSWANSAFLAATGFKTLRDALASDATLDRSERDLARTASEGHDVVRAKRYAVIDGQRRALAIDLRCLPDASVAGIAVDVTEAAQAEAMLRLNADATADVMDRIETAIAVFGTDERLIACNKAYERMWGLTEEWLDTHPTLGEILDHLREERRLPEQHDFAAWKRDQLQLFDGDRGQEDETWHLPGGGSVRVKTYPYLPGGIAYLFEDISERLSLQVSYNMLAQMQRATLNTVEDGMAVFGPDGRLKLHNDAFARLWQLSESELSGEPHLTKVAELCVARTGHDGIWNIVAEGANSAEPARYNEWGKVTRSDGRILSLSLSRLPLGATLVIFADLTDFKRFESGLSETPSTAA